MVPDMFKKMKNGHSSSNIWEKNILTEKKKKEGEDDNINHNVFVIRLE